MYGFKSMQLYLILLCAFISHAQVVLENEIKITDFGLHFDGSKVTSGATNTGDSSPYDYYFGRNISAHGDCIKTYNEYVFMTWYRGGKDDRHVMLTRYNTNTGSQVTVEFPHRHTGYQNKYWIGESHNSIAVAVSPIDGTIHLLYDMHAYSNTRPSDGSLSNDYFRYSYSVKNAASVPDGEFTLNQFVQNNTGGYKHLSLNGGEDYTNFAALTYPQFFLNDAGDIFMYMREGGNNNGAYKFSKYDATTSTWSSFTHFNVLNAKNQSGIDYNWGLYGNMKYVNGKIRIGFQRRLANNNDKYQYQNGVYYAYSDNQNGTNAWKNHQGQNISLPLYDADLIKVMEPGDYVQSTEANKVYIVGDFDWTVTNNGDVHIISKVKDNQYNVTKYLHTYKPAGSTDFITTEDFSRATSIYTAGDNIYIIGLTSAGRVFVEKAEGGTNNFTRVYEATSGRTFDHGRVHIADGKLYYYLMEDSSGDARPLYLQIVDLDIHQDPFRVSLTSPTSGEVFEVGETVQISANAIDENNGISKVEFRVNGSYHGEDNTEPYTINFISNTEGDQSIQAVAYNTNNETVSSAEITINFKIHDPTDLTNDVYKLKNVATGKYLTSDDSNLIGSDSGDGVAKEWEFVNAGTGDFVNINSRTSKGVLRFTGGSAGTMINTSFSPPRTDTDKIWTVHYHQADDNYSFETNNVNRYLYHDVNEGIIHSSSSDNGSRWVLESTSEDLSTDDVQINSIKVFPNPASESFTISFKGATNASVIIYNILGETIYKEVTSNQTITINNHDRFKPGVYLIRIVGDYHKVLNTKLIIE